MKIFQSRLFLLLSVILIVLLIGISEAQQLAFPTAQGWGRFSTGGRGGKVYNINSLSGALGSGGTCNAGGCTGGTITFLDCWTDRFGVGPRTCVFKVGGIIDIPMQYYYPLTGNITIAGQTAPGGGITIRGDTLMVCTGVSCTPTISNFIARHFRVRPGSGRTALGAISHYDAHEVIWDHMSFGWADGDNTGAVVSTYNMTIQWSIISEPLSWGFAAEPGKGFLLQTCGPTTDFGGISLHHNLLSSVWDRAPWLQCGNVQFVNNISYNSKNSTLIDTPTHGTRVHANFVGNYYKTGPDTITAPIGLTQQGILVGCCPGTGPQCNSSSSCPFIMDSGVYVYDNYHNVYRPTGTEPQNALVTVPAGTSIPLVSTAYDFPVIVTTSPVQAHDDVLAKAGAYAVAGGLATVRRDSIDQRGVTDVDAGTGRMIAYESDVGGYPAVANGTPYTDTDGDGIEDAWETAHGLNPADPSDGPALAAGQPPGGYTNLEIFLNELAGDTAAAPTGATLVALYPLDGSGADTSGNANTLTLSGSPGTCVGHAGTGLQCNGTNQYGTAPDQNWLHLSTTFSLAAWVKLDSPQTSYRSVIMKNGSYFLYGVIGAGYCGAGGVMAGFESSSGPQVVCDPNSLSVGQWTHLAMTYDGAALRLYRNGVLAVTQAATGTATVGTGTLQVGASQYGEYWPGCLDDVRIYSGTLTASQVAALAATTTGTDPGQPWVWWKLDENTGSTAIDSGTCGCNGTLQGSPTWTTGKLGSALQFSGSAQWVDNTTAAWPASSPVTVSFWANFAAPGATRGIFDIGRGATAQNIVSYIQSGNTMTWIYSTGPTPTVTTSIGTVLNQWVHIAVTSSGAANRSIYINGTLANTDSTAGTAPAAQTGLEIGRGNLAGSGFFYWVGKLDDFRVFTRVLTTSEIAFLAGGGAAPQAVRRRSG